MNRGERRNNEFNIHEADALVCLGGTHSVVMLETGFSATVDLSKTHTSDARQAQLSFPAKAVHSASLLSTEGSFRALHAGR